jgi:hypothetical protein
MVGLASRGWNMHISTMHSTSPGHPPFLPSLTLLVACIHAHMCKIKIISEGCKRAMQDDQEMVLITQIYIGGI